MDENGELGRSDQHWGEMGASLREMGNIGEDVEHLLYMANQ